MLAITATLAFSSVRSVPRDSWITIGGKGHIRSWSVDETSTHLKVISISGVKRVFELKPFEFKEGFFFVVGLLAVSEHSLLVTHEQGAFLVNDKGAVQKTLSLTQNGISKSDPMYSLDRPGSESTLLETMKPLAFNGNTILCRDWRDKSSITLVGSQLNWVETCSFRNGFFSSASPNGAAGWIVTVKEGTRFRRFNIQNDGSLRAK